MGCESVLARYYSCAADVDHEDAWVASALAHIDGKLVRGEWQQALEACASFLTDMEGHFAFEELVISRTEFGRGQAHRNHHAAGLAVIRDMLHEMSAGKCEEDATRLRAKLQDFSRHVEQHVAQDDQQLCRHTARLLGAKTAGRSGSRPDAWRDPSA